MLYLFIISLFIISSKYCLDRLRSSFLIIKGNPPVLKYSLNALKTSTLSLVVLYSGFIFFSFKNSLKEKGNSFIILFLPVKKVDISELNRFEFEPVTNTLIFFSIKLIT